MLDIIGKTKSKGHRNEMIDVKKIIEMNQLKSQAKQLFNECELFGSK